MVQITLTHTAKVATNRLIETKDITSCISSLIAISFAFCYVYVLFYFCFIVNA